MNELVWLGINMGLLILLMFVHEFIHWITLKILGYSSSKLIFLKKGLWIFPGMGIKPIGVRENFVHAKDIYLVLMMPMLFGWMFFIPLLYPRFTYLDVIFGFAIWFGASSMDLKNASNIRKWWLKPHKNIVFR